ncbi:hypothetical protein [Novosphingobium sp.]|uniref:hypothetical protein n=1 Tax=Novosphingobium sp. TaxID=1874826 RepID=UPI00286B4127|nr:hypothetical protein [Novosphingobium sp.]
MSYSEHGSRFWQVDLTTADGARSAARSAGTAAFIYGGLAVLVAMLFGQLFVPIGKYGQTSLNLMPFGISFLAVVAGFRLRDGKGLIAGSLLAVVVVFNVLANLASLSGWGGTAINVVVLIVLVQGLRGASALRRGLATADEELAAFD